MQNPQWFCKNTCSFIFRLISKKFFGQYSTLLQLFRFGVSGYTPPSPVSAEPAPWLEDGKLTFAFFYGEYVAIKNLGSSPSPSSPGTPTTPASATPSSNSRIDSSSAGATYTQKRGISINTPLFCERYLTYQAALVLRIQWNPPCKSATKVLSNTCPFINLRWNYLLKN